MSIHLSWLIVYCILVQQKLDTLVAFTNGVLYASTSLICLCLRHPNWSPWTSIPWA